MDKEWKELDDAFKMHEDRLKDIELFYDHSSRNKNDSANKIREKIICDLANNLLPDELLTCEKWRNLNSEVKRVIQYLKPDNSDRYEFRCAGGRSKNYDFMISFYESDIVIKECKLEFKYGADEIDDCPQWVSPMKPSQYFNTSYEELFYDNYMSKLCSRYNVDMPDRSIYLDKIHNDKPECMSEIQAQYYRGAKKSSRYTGLEVDKDNYKYAIELNNESIKEFLEKSVLDVDRLNNYFKTTQKNKTYILWNNGKFNVRTRNEDDYQISEETLALKNNNCLCGKTKSGYPIKILLRWKNGVAYPALQIS